MFGDEIRDLDGLLKIEQDSKLRARESVTAFFPPPAFAAGIMRREAHLSREYDRNLNQLEHLRRISKGGSGPPTLKVEMSC